MSDRIHTFSAAPAVPLDSRIPWSSARGLPRYAIQFRLDSDDLIAPDYAATAIRRLADLRGPRSVVWFQPYKLDVATGRVFWCAPARGRRRYANDRPSAFLALRQPIDSLSYSWVYGVGHTRAAELANDVAGIAEGHCVAVCHEFNDSTHVNPGDRHIDRSRAPWL